MGSRPKKEPTWRQWLEKWFKIPPRRQETLAKVVHLPVRKSNRRQPSDLKEFDAMMILVRSLIARQVETLVAEDKYLLSLGVKLYEQMKKEQELKAEELRQKRQHHERISFYLNIYFVVFCLMFVSALIGVSVGVNVPEAIACRSEDTPCWHLRIRPNKGVK